MRIKTKSKIRKALIIWEKDKKQERKTKEEEASLCKGYPQQQQANLISFLIETLKEEDSKDFLKIS